MEDYFVTLPDTQTQEDYIESSQITQEATVNSPWGRLSPCIPSLPSIDLFESSYVCGRAPTCHIIIEKSQFPSVLNISKEHFQIIKDEDVVFLVDLSKNGTFINYHKIGKNKRNILHTSDVISLGQPHLKAFTFNCHINGDNFLPKELRSTYVISKFLGHGACGEVRLAFDKRSCEKFAIKKIHKSMSSSDVNKLNHPQKIQTEIKILKTFSHPFIIDMKEFFEGENDVFLVLEYMEGGDLGGLIRSLVPLSESLVKFIFYQVVLAIQYLHEHGVTHRDLKPENVLLSDGTFPLVKVSDFGLSKMMSEISLMETVCGTITYVAPEILHQEKRYSNKVDVWSLGVILFYMLCKTLPFIGPDRETVAHKIIKGKFDFTDKAWKGVSGTAKDLIKKMLNTNPNQRISVDDILKHPWIERDIAMQYKVNQLRVRDDIEGSSTSLFTPPPKKARYTEYI